MHMIPNVLHFVFFGNKKYPFGLLHYLAIKSAQDVNRPERIFLHTNCAPKSIWWDRIKSFVTVEHTSVPHTVFGNKILCWPHRSDVARLRKLYKHGGIYMDFDTLCLRPFTDLLKYPCVMGRWYGNPSTTYNAVILAEPQSKFIKTWYNTYRTFSGLKWTEHSGSIPYLLSKRPNAPIHVLDRNSFFCSPVRQMRPLFESSETDIFDRSYCIHYNNTLNQKRWLSAIDEDYVRTSDTVFAKIARRHIGV